MIKKKILYFVLLVTVSVLYGCFSTSASVRQSDIKAVTGDTRAVKSYAAEAKYGERPKTALKTPGKYKPVAPDKIVISDDNIKVILYAKEFAQGNAGYFEADCKEGKACEIKKISFAGEDIPFTCTDWGCRGFFAIHPEAKPVKTFFTMVYFDGVEEKKIESSVKIRDVQYPVSESLLDLGKFSDKEYTSKPEFKKLIEESAEARRKAFSTVSEDSITNALAHPRDLHKVTGDYWKKRIYAGYKKKGKRKVKVKDHESYHRGLDLKGDLGAPVYSMADGKIVLAMKMFYEGNLVAVDHGNQVFTYYMHMDSMAVKVGDTVKAGDLVGRVGSTGTSTGPHLHVALSIRGVHVHPLSLLSLPVSR